jgi:DNA-binding CsgD family transcriptional regulator
MHKVKRNTYAVSGVEAAAFAFCDRSSGAVRFQVRPTPDGELPVEEAASLLAMHCLVHSQRPDDYVVLVMPRTELLEQVDQRAQQLLSVGRRAAESHVQLSARQREVLEHVLRDLSNKEIGVRLNVAERTVKFHVSQLLVKFKAQNRAGLKREAAIGMLPVSAVPSDTLFGFVVPPAVEEPPKASDPQAVRLLDFGSGRPERTRGVARVVS